ncbi:(Fe-S)-binding protein [Peribacillus sp. SCS-26]|uniref:(Fe-S)-binding protein n=1 Tax=Paraperibacillus marinus TaxID=3115295 RepID=UPI0039067064
MISSLESKAISEEFKVRMDEDELLNCMRCGFCLPSCPTYIASGNDEAQSPRGRIALMKAVADGIIDWDGDVDRSLSQCLGCRACEPVCPSGVKYGHLLEEARDIIHQNKKHSAPVRAVRNTVFNGLFPRQDRMRQLTGLIGLYQSSGLQHAVRKIGFLKLFPGNLEQMEKTLPAVPRRRELSKRPQYLEPDGKKTARVAFFSGCLMDTLFLKTNDRTMKLLQLAGCEIVIPENQACCGALHGHSGEKEGAKELARRNILAFEELHADYIITNAGGCGAFLKDYDVLLQDDPAWGERAVSFTEKIKDITQILFEMDFHKNFNLYLEGGVITYQDSCHLKNVMKTESAPRQLLKSINGIEFREMKDAGSCCGSAGVYNIVEPEMSMKILDSKMKNVRDVVPDMIVTANPGCLLQMKLGIQREGLEERIEAVHIADLLYLAAGQKSI